ncbi:MAG: hypothetical protein AABM29_03975 [Actinomycetota bacterium]
MTEESKDQESKDRQSSTKSQRSSFSGSEEISPLLATTSEKVQEILRTTNEAAEQIRRDARNEAREFVEEARKEAREFVEEARNRAERLTNERMERIAKLTEDLLQQASAVQEQAATLRVALEKATIAIDNEVEEIAGLDTEASEVGDDEEDQQQEEETSSTSESGLRARFGRRRRKPVAPQETSGVSEGVRVLALQQLIAGADRETIETRLREDFGIEDPKAILESIEAEVPSG